MKKKLLLFLMLFLLAGNLSVLAASASVQNGELANFFNGSIYSLNLQNFPVGDKLGRSLGIFPRLTSAGLVISSKSRLSGFNVNSEMIENLLPDLQMKLGVTSFYPRPLIFPGFEKSIATRAVFQWQDTLPVKIEATAGPSYQLNNLAGQPVPAPGNSVGFLTSLNDLNIFGRYQVHYLSPEGGRINRLKGGVSYKVPMLNNLNLELAGESLVPNVNFLKSNLLDSFRWQLQTVMEPLSRVELSSVFSGGRLNREAVLVGARLKLKDYFSTGTDFSVEGYRAGSSYYDEFKALPTETVFDSFNYLLNSGQSGVGAGLRQEVFDETLSLLGKVNLNFDKNFKKATWELGVAYNINPTSHLEAAYRSHFNLSEKERVLEYMTAGMNLEF